MRGDLGDQVGDLGFQRLDRLGQFADAAQLVARDPDAHRLLSPSEPTRDPGAPGTVKQRAAREPQIGPEIVQMPLQRVVDRDPLSDEPLAVIGQQPQIELRPIQMRRRQRVEPFAQRRSGDRERVDAVGLPAPTRLAPRRRTSACYARAAPARRARSRSVPASPRHAGSPRSPRRVRRPGRAPSAAVLLRPWRPTGPFARRAASPDAAATAAIVCERLWVSAPSTIIELVHLHFDQVGQPGGHGLLGAVPRSYQVTPGHPRPATSDTAKASQAQGRQPESESARRRSGPSPQRRTSPTTRIKTASLKSGAACAARGRCFER